MAAKKYVKSDEEWLGYCLSCFPNDGWIELPGAATKAEAAALLENEHKGHDNIGLRRVTNYMFTPHPRR